MALLLEKSRSSPVAEWRSGDALSIGLVNNMPDAALEATERQFTALVRAAAGKTAVSLTLFSIAEVPRSDAARQDVVTRYRDIATLWDTHVDGLIVTGNEPRAANMKDEPYWPTLAKLVDWSRDNTASTIWSCLAAHA